MYVRDRTVHNPSPQTGRYRGGSPLVPFPAGPAPMPFAASSPAVLSPCPGPFCKHPGVPCSRSQVIQVDCCRKLGSPAPHKCVFAPPLWHGTWGSPRNAGSRRGSEVPVVLEARRAGEALRPRRGRNQLVLESGGWAASGSDSISSLRDVSPSGHKDARDMP